MLLTDTLPMLINKQILKVFDDVNNKFETDDPTNIINTKGQLLNLLFLHEVIQDFTDFEYFEKSMLD